MMGATADEQDSNADGFEKPQHQVTLTQGFWMGKYELTKAQWTAVMGTTPWLGQANVLNDPDSSATYISWNLAQSFITTLNNYTGLTFRLPSEAQWEYAARAGTTTRFFWGDDSSYTQLLDYAWCLSNCSVEQYGHLVGQKTPNGLGLYDMNGNQWEFCQDWHGAYTVDAVMDPTGPTTGTRRVIRGGCWRSSNSSCRSASRYYAIPSYVSSNFGFRLVR